MTGLDTSENRNGQGLPPNVARSDAVVLGSLFSLSGWAAKDFGCRRLTGRRWDSGWRGERPSLYRVLSGSKSVSISSATLVSAASVEVKKSKSGRPLLSWYHWMASPSETIRSFVAQGCFDLFVGAGKEATLLRVWCRDGPL